jgi:hypothetical protein
MTRLFLLAIIILSALAIDMKINNKTIIDEKPKLLASVPNGQKLLIGDMNDP